MRNNISVVIFDKEYFKRSFTKIKSIPFYRKEETKFDITVFPDTDNVEEKLSSCRGYDCIVTIGDLKDYPELFNKTVEIRKKWIHFDQFKPEDISEGIINVFKSSLGAGKDDGSPIFSICTCAYKTTEEMATRLYTSILKQSYTNWNWWILDDSPDGEDSYFVKFKDPRITIIRNVNTHGNIGFNKRILGMACTGDYIVEVDHDDEISYDCLELLKKAFDTYTDCDFAYSYAIEEIDGAPITYEDGFALGLGTNEDVPFEDNGSYFISTTPNVNALSVRHIVSVPNHVRCWKKEFYQKIGGHNPNLSICDDFDLLVRTAMNGKMCKIPKILYIQHEGTTEKSSRGSTTQAKRFGEIVRVGKFIKERYDFDIHNFFTKKTGLDPYWNEEYGFSNILDGPKDGTENINYTLTV